MIRATIYIKGHDWKVHCFFAVHSYFTEEILNTLFLIGCRDRKLRRAYESLKRGKLDEGFTFSNEDVRESVLVTNITSSAAEFANSLAHEIRHLESHIASADGMNEKGEAVCYLVGDITRSLYPVCKELLCDCCRGRMINKS